MESKISVDQRLAESFIELILKMPMEKITIKDITDGAGVIRPTFYNHFQDKYELLEWIINRDLIEPVRPFIRSGLMTQAMTFLFINIEKEKNFYLKVSRLDGQNSFYSIAQNCIQVLFEEVCGEHRKRRQPKYEWLTPKRLAQYYGQSMVFVLIEWIQSGMTISAEDLAELYQYMISHSLEDSLKDL